MKHLLLAAGLLGLASCKSDSALRRILVVQSQTSILMPFIELKDSKDESFAALINANQIGSVDIIEGTYTAPTITVKFPNGESVYSRAYETRQDAENAFTKLRAAIMTGEGTVTL